MYVFFIMGVCLLSGAFSLTSDDMAKFGSKPFNESNTGIQGWVYVEEDGDYWRITANGIPDHETGEFPSRGSPNSIEEQSYDYSIPHNPTVASEPTCLNPGVIGIAINGVVFYSPWTSQGKDAVAFETFDVCDGHPNANGVYHYHKMPSSCLFTIEEGTPSGLIGVALDGFGIYGPVSEDGVTLTSEDLDECHGRYNGDGVYQYHTTSDFPYVLGCYSGTPEVANRLLNSDSCHFASDADEDGSVAK